MARHRGQSRATPAELAVIGALLGDDPAGQQLFRQVACSTDVQRAMEGPDYRLTLVETTEDLLVDLHEDVTSEWQGAPDKVSGQRLEFRIVLRRGGFFGSLEGRSLAGAWPVKWQVAEDDLRGFRVVTLPARGACDRLLAWLGDMPAAIDVSHVRCGRPAKSSDIRDVEQREDAPLPEDLGELLQITDGLTVGNVEVHGCPDLFVTELAGKPWWVVASERGEAFVVRQPGEATAPYLRVQQGQEEPSEGESLGATAAELIRRLLQECVRGTHS